MSQLAGPKIVKRYANRKLYDTEKSAYTTLKTLVQEIVEGREIQVVSNVTKEDITGQTLLMALIETNAEEVGQADTVRSILKAGGLTKYIQNLKQAAIS